MAEAAAKAAFADGPLFVAAKHLLAQYGFSTELDFITLSSWAMLISGVSSFFALMFFKAPYGKYSSDAHPLYGPKMNGKLAWILQEAPSFLIAAFFWLLAAQDPARRAAVTSLNANTVLMALYLFHYFNRSFVYPLRIRGGKPTPLVVFLMALVFCIWNGWMQGRYLSNYANYSADTLYQPHFVIGVLLFFTGMWINWSSDDILRNLRAPGETGYKIPSGGMFEYVSGANFFGEILEWSGFALAAWSLPAAAFAAFTFCNIGPRGAQHHKWYQGKFKDYPLGRKAVIPFIW